MEKITDHVTQELLSDLQEMGHKIFLDIMAQRNEIAIAFVAKYGAQPDEIEQVILHAPNGFSWSLRLKREKSENEKSPHQN